MNRYGQTRFTTLSHSWFRTYAKYLRVSASHQTYLPRDFLRTVGVVRIT